MFLTSDDIEELTGYKNHAKQISWLARNGIKFLISGDGKPKVLQSQIELLIGGTSAPSRRKTEPNFERLERLANGA